MNLNVGLKRLVNFPEFSKYFPVLYPDCTGICSRRSSGSFHRSRVPQRLGGCHFPCTSADRPVMTKRSINACVFALGYKVRAACRASKAAWQGV
ncbi:hypothetical protein AEP_00811 [Curvibacter sp. AEP1-3]|nr:hypothetical protein AEP_00811 [Curvibacter sp. AEP1-3]